MVTGASSGLGSEFCLNLAKAGCKIVAAARRVDRLKSLCDEINNLTHSNLPPNADPPLRAVAVELDVTSDGSSIGASVQKAWEAFGRIDALLNNAGIRGKFWFDFGKEFSFCLFSRKKEREFGILWLMRFWYFRNATDWGNFDFFFFEHFYLPFGSREIWMKKRN